MIAGISPGDFYNMTLLEINLYIEAYNKKFKADNESKAAMLYKLADMIGVSVNRAGDFPEIYEFFPGMFEDIKLSRIKGSWAKAIKKER